MATVLLLNMFLWLRELRMKLVLGQKTFGGTMLLQVLPLNMLLLVLIQNIHCLFCIPQEPQVNLRAYFIPPVGT